MFARFLNTIKSQDYFAERVSLTQDGKTTYRSVIGGIVSIFICVSVVGYGLSQVLDLYFNPVYNALPITYDYDYG